ncbi:MAG: hypothetical protein ABEL76_08895 [Bradymonadaceae bacterium]
MPSPPREHGSTESAPVPEVGLVSALVLGLASLSISCSPDSAPETGDAGSDSKDAADTHPTDGRSADSEDGRTDGSDASATGVRLIDNEEWLRIGAADDPLDEHRPGIVNCPESAYGTETVRGETNFEVDTGKCNYFSGKQTALAPIDEGDRLRARIWHFQLTAERPSKAHVALLLDEEIVWEERVTIPASAGWLTPSWRADSAYDSGTRVGFHLHNHGSNAWRLVRFQVVRAD